MRKTVVITSDDHEGSPVALPPCGDSWDYIDGGPKPICDWQLRIWEHWDDCWLQIGDLRKGAELIVVHGGDAIEGVHHQTVELLTQRIDEQERMHVAAMRYGLAKARFNPKRDKLIYLTGTPSHVGQGNTSTERIARLVLGCPADAKLDGSVLRHRLYATVNGTLIDVAHKGFKLGTREWTRTNTMRAYLTSRWITSLKYRKPMPRYVVRAHRHTFGYAALEDDDGRTVSEAFLTPAWKLKDEYVWDFAPEAVSNIGLLVLIFESDGTSRVKPLTMRCEQDEVEEL